MGASTVRVVGGRRTARLVFATLEPAFPAGAVHLLLPDPDLPEGDREVRGVVSTGRTGSDEETATRVERALREEPRLLFERVGQSFVIRAAEGAMPPLPAQAADPDSSEGANTSTAPEEGVDRPRWPWEPR